MLTVKVKLFGAFRKYADGKELELKLERPMSVSELRDALASRLEALHPGFKERGLIADSAFADERQVLRSDARIESSCSIAVLPPVCGG